MSATSPKNLAIWIVMALLIVGLMGFGTVNLSGRSKTLGEVGDKTITLQSFANALRQRLQAEGGGATPLPVAEAEQRGIPDQVLAQLLSTRLLENEAARLGVSIGDQRVADQITAVPAFAGADGSFDRASYEYLLERQGLNEADFEEGVRDEQARMLLQLAVAGGITAPPALSDRIMAYVGETRQITWAPVGTAQLTAPPAPINAEDLAAYHAAHTDQYVAPETRSLTAAKLLPEMVAATIEIDENTLRKLYDERIADYRQPERRLVERLVFGDAQKADAARARLDAGEADFETLVDEMGLELANLDLGDVTPADLGPAGEAVFAATAGDVVGPIEIDRGPALFRVNAILAAQETPFESARESLREELAADQSHRNILMQRENLTDLLAGGARLEDLAERSAMALESFTWSAGNLDGLAAYHEVAEAIPALEQGALPRLIELDDGGLVALRLDSVTAAAPQPLEAVRDAVAADLQAERLREALSARAADLAETLNGGASFADLGLAAETETGLRRGDAITAGPVGMVARAFQADPGTVLHVSGPNGQALLRVDSVTPGDPENADLAQVQAGLNSSLAQSMAEDLLTTYSGEVQRTTDVTVNRDAVQAVLGQLR